MTSGYQRTGHGSKRLSAAYVKYAPPGKHYDEHGLFLRVTLSGSKQWLQRIQYDGMRHELGLGSPPWVSLAEAREKAFENKRMAKRGGDPLAHKRKPSVPKFEQASAKVIALYAETWKDGGRTAKIWESRLRRHAFPRLGGKRVDKIDTRDVMAVLAADLERETPDGAARSAVYRRGDAVERGARPSGG